MLELTTPVQYVKGVGPRIAEILAAKGVQTLEDLLFYLPFRYEDRLNPRPIGGLRPGAMASGVGAGKRDFAMVSPGHPSRAGAVLAGEISGGVEFAGNFARRHSAAAGAAIAGRITVASALAAGGGQLC